MAGNKLKLGRNKLVFVDGFKVRNMVDDDFGIISGHSESISLFSPDFYIPEGEIWFDPLYKDELEFLFEEWSYNPKEAVSGLQFKELAKKKFCRQGPVPKFRIKQEKRAGVKVVYIDGKIVRQYIDPEFILGGHEFVYSYIPKGEIWLDNKMDSKEIPYIFLHEKVERDLMKRGKSYDVAHEYATAVDKEKKRADGIASYSGDDNYIWRGKTVEEIIKKLIVKP